MADKKTAKKKGESKFDTKDDALKAALDELVAEFQA